MTSLVDSSTAPQMDDGGDKYRRARQVLRDTLKGKVMDKYGRSIAHAKFTGEKPSFLLYGGVGLIAIFKDLLDLIGIGSLPAIGWVITFCFTFLIWILLTLFDRSDGKQNMKLIRGLVTIGFGLVEGVAFGLNFFPIETTMVVVLYILAKRAWKKAKKEHEKSAQSGASV